MNRSRGLAIWLPDSLWDFDRYRERYRNLVFNRDTRWLDAVTAILAAKPN
jgi:hypothetical protein